MKLLTFAALKTAKGHPYTRRHTERLVKQGRFPPPINVGEKRIAWIEEEVDAKLAEWAAERGSGVSDFKPPTPRANGSKA